MKPFKTIFLTLAVIFSFTACYKTPTEGFKVEGSIANIQDYPSNEVMVFLPGNNFNFKVKISESKLSNNWFSLFLPYELKDKYCDAIDTKKYIFFNPEFESYLTISNKNVKISDVWFNSNKEYNLNGNIMYFGYGEEYDYYNGAGYVTLVKTKYVYAQSAVSITGEYETRLNVIGEDLYKTVKMDLFLQKGWNIIYYIGSYTSKPNTSFWDLDTSIVKITAEKPENIELKWYYCSFNDLDIVRFLRDNSDAKFMYMPFMIFYYEDFILTTF